MDRRMEQSMKEIQKFLDEHATDDMSMDDINALLNAHMGTINAGMMARKTEETAETADDFMFLADEYLQKGDEQGALRMARKALKLEPDNLDAEWFIIQREEKDPEHLPGRMKQALDRGQATLEKQGYFDEDSIGHFWQILETRPYIRLKDEYVSLLKELGRLKMAAREAEEIIRLNEQDNLGVRFTLMHLYAMLEDADSAEALLKKYSEHDESQMLLALALLCYKLGEKDRAEKYLRRLTKINKETRAFARDLQADNLDRKFEEIRKRGGYSPDSEEELIMTVKENEEAYESAPLFFRWMAQALKI